MARALEACSSESHLLADVGRSPVGGGLAREGDTT